MRLPKGVRRNTRIGSLCFMLRLCSVRCPHMNQITMEDTLRSLERTEYIIDVPEPIRVRAARAVERMLLVG